MPSENVNAINAFIQVRRFYALEKSLGIKPPHSLSAIFEKLEGFRASVPGMSLFKPDGKPKPEWRVFYGGTWEEAHELAFGHLKEGISDIVPQFPQPISDLSIGVNASLGVAREAKAAGRDWVTGVARMMAHDVVPRTSNGFYDGTWCPEDSISLKASLILMSDLDFEGKEKFIRIADAMLEVWAKGYAYEGDANGVLYVYAKK